MTGVLTEAERDLLDLLREFKIGSVADYHRLPPGRKPYLVRRLFKVFQRSEDALLKQVRAADGIKLHFHTSGDLTSMHTNLPSETFLKKLSFYSNLTLITFPFKEITDKAMLRRLRKKPQHAWRKREAAPMLFGEIQGQRTPVDGFMGATGKAYTVDPEAFDDFLTVCVRLTPALQVGAALVVPQFADSGVLRN